jgi:predicted dehydrogenase
MAAAARMASAAEADRLVVGVVGPGGMGTNHLHLLTSRSDVSVAYVCDPDRNRMAQAAKLVEERTG